VLIGCAVSWIALLAAAPAVRAAARLRPVAAGGRGDLFDDLGPLVPTRMRGHDWALAFGVAGAVAVVITLAGVAQSDGFDGAARGIADALACLAGFALLGSYLGIRACDEIIDDSDGSRLGPLGIPPRHGRAGRESSS
jgi:hypothetical protein